MSLHPFGTFHHFAVFTTFAETSAKIVMHSSLAKRTHIYLSLTSLYLSLIISDYIYRFTDRALLNICSLMLPHYCTYPPCYQTSYSYSALDELNFLMSRCKTSYVSVNFASFALSSICAISYCCKIRAFSTKSSSIHFQ